LLKISRETVNLWLIIRRVHFLVRHRQWQQRRPRASIDRPHAHRRKESRSNGSDGHLQQLARRGSFLGQSCGRPSFSSQHRFPQRELAIDDNSAPDDEIELTGVADRQSFKLVD
jgi:hypothetical protein